MAEFRRNYQSKRKLYGKWILPHVQVLNLLAQVYAGVDHAPDETIHITATEVLVLEGQLNQIQGHRLQGKTNTFELYEASIKDGLYLRQGNCMVM